MDVDVCPCSDEGHCNNPAMDKTEHDLPIIYTLCDNCELLRCSLQPLREEDR